MTRIILVAFDGAQGLDVWVPRRCSPPSGAPRAARVRGRPRVAGAAGSIRTTSGMAVRPAISGACARRSGDTVVVSGGEEAGVAGRGARPALLRWLARAHRVVERMASVCSGAFVLADAGILDGRRATTHWSACDLLASRFPRVDVDANAIFVQDGAVWTSAGVTTGIDMALAMVEGDLGRAAADAIAARLVLYVRRPGFQSQFSDALVAQTSSADPLRSGDRVGGRTSATRTSRRWRSTRASRCAPSIAAAPTASRPRRPSSSRSCASSTRARSSRPARCRSRRSRPTAASAAGPDEAGVRARARRRPQRVPAALPSPGAAATSEDERPRPGGVAPHRALGPSSRSSRAPRSTARRWPRYTRAASSRRAPASRTSARVPRRRAR